jgi:muramoyltetrapeptide carboxypeptidase LdcA involved in peptidoglycan recycling
MLSLTIPQSIKQGDTIGICTPAMPAYSISNEVFENGVKNVEKAGFFVKLGNLTKNRASEGYRSAGPKERAKELMDLFVNPSVKAILTTIGGMNSNSLIPFLDFEVIKSNPKIFCGYSDITSLHLSLMKYSNLATYYGPGLMPHWSEYPDAINDSIQSFLEALETKERILKPFCQWSNHSRDWQTDAWKTLPRVWKENAGWKVLSPGKVSAPILICNLNTLMSAAGTDYFPDVQGKVLLIEEMDAPLSKEERSLRQLQLMGVFDKLGGLIMGKPENLKLEGAPFGLDELLMEIVGPRKYPIISGFDCSHTIPMHTIRQLSFISFEAQSDYLDQIKIHD